MEVLLAAGVGAALLALLVWADRGAERAMTKERAELQIRHLPDGVRARLRAAQLRSEAERDLH